MPAPRVLFSLLAAATAALTAACGSSNNGSGSTAASPQTITLFAAASTAAVMAEEIAAFTRLHPEIHVEGDYEGTQSLLTKLQADGTAADVFLSADRKHMDTAVQAGIAKDPADLMSNRLVIAVPSGNPAHVTSIADLARSGVRVVLADASVPAGTYAEQALHSAEKNGEAAAGFAATVLHNVVSRESDVEQVVAKVAAGEVDAGMVYATDAQADHRITAIQIPAADQPATVYPIAVTTHARAAAAARTFVAFLRSAAGLHILRAAGFVVAQ